MTMLLIIIASYHFITFFIKRWDGLNFDHYVLTNNIPQMTKIKETHLQKKILSLMKLNEQLSSKYSITTPILLLANTGTDRAVASISKKINYIVFEKMTLENLSEKALGAILAHELCHIKNTHENKLVWTNIFLYLLGFISLGVSFSYLNIELVANDLEKGTQDFAKTLLILANFFFFFPKFVKVTLRCLSRHIEIQCDLFAASNTSIRAFFEQAHYFDSRYDSHPSKTLFQKIKGFFKNTHPSWKKRKEAVKFLRVYFANQHYPVTLSENLMKSESYKFGTE